MIDQYSQQVNYKEPLLLFHHDGRTAAQRQRRGRSGVHEDRSRRAAWPSATTITTALDVLIGNNGGAPVLLKNNAGDGNHWLGVKLEGVNCNRDAIGARSRGRPAA